ncbi:MAG: DUF4258 domain-containing protein [Candidatus Pacebacteria bacterium]|nr:DUF4258 domain-containing protein [Candidatus Paceibacterota bacterium]
MDKNYKNLVFTNHAFDRIKGRTITKDAVYQTIKNSSKKFKQGQSTKFIKTVNGRKIHAVANYLKNENKWLVISVWVRGEDDKAPIIWTLITLPFKLTYKILIWVLKRLTNFKK